MVGSGRQEEECRPMGVVWEVNQDIRSLEAAHVSQILHIAGPQCSLTVLYFSQPSLFNVLAAVITPPTHTTSLHLQWEFKIAELEAHAFGFKNVSL